MTTTMTVEQLTSRLHRIDASLRVETIHPKNPARSRSQIVIRKGTSVIAAGCTTEEALLSYGRS